MAAPPILELRGLTTVFRTSAGDVTPVRAVDLRVAAGETLALVGESGSGKTVTGLSCLRLLPQGSARITAGQILFSGADGQTQDLATLNEEAMRQLRGNRIAMVFQEPMTCLNPVFTIGEQIAEPLRIHLGLSHRQAAARAVEPWPASASPMPQPRPAASLTSSPAASASAP